MITLVCPLTVVTFCYWWCSWLCVYFVGGGVAYVYMSSFIVDRVRLWFRFVCYLAYICVLC